MGTAQINTSILEGATRKMKREERQHFINFFVGAMSIDVPPEKWEKAVIVAQDCMRLYVYGEKKH